MNDLIIRKANINDLDSIINLLYQVQNVHSDLRPDLFISGSRKYTNLELEAILNDSLKPIFVAELNNNVVGYAFTIITIPISHTLAPIKTLYIDDLCVDKDYRGNHIGLSLYNYTLDYAKKINCYNVTLNVWADNEDALRFYKKIGLKIQKIGMERIL